jgi:hypothetical protein
MLEPLDAHRLARRPDQSGADFDIAVIDPSLVEPIARPAPLSG